tara:strand:- start:148 stop:249 length:102 start_codon:yes stop_codon:yes gene_type:complete
MDISFGEISSQEFDSNEPNFKIIEAVDLSRREN